MNTYTTLRPGTMSETRLSGVGASDIPVLAGLTARYGQTPLTLWRQKTRRDPPFRGNDATWWGHVHENSVLMRYVRDHYDEDTAELFLGEKMAHKSIRPFIVEAEFRRTDYPFAMAHPDLLIEDTPMLVEAKSHGLFTAQRKDDPDFGYDPDDRSQEGIPAAVFLQMQWQFYCGEIPAGMAAVLINTNDYREYGAVVADKKVQEQCLALADRFWWHVQQDREPAPATWRDVTLLYPSPKMTTAMYPLETPLRESEEGAITLADMLMRAEKAKASKKRAERELSDIENALGVLLGENRILADPDGNVLAKRQISEYPSLSLAALRKEHPDVWALVEPYCTTARRDYIAIR